MNSIEIKKIGFVIILGIAMWTKFMKKGLVYSSESMIGEKKVVTEREVAIDVKVKDSMIVIEKEFAIEMEIEDIW